MAAHGRAVRAPAATVWDDRPVTEQRMDAPGGADAARAPAAPNAARQVTDAPTVALPVPGPPPDSGTLVVEDGVIPRRLRRPLDLARFLLAVALVAGTVVIAYFASSTTSGIDSDLEEGVRRLPDLVVLVLNIVGGIGILGLPVAAAVYLVVRRRVRQLFDALIGLLLTVVVLTVAAMLLQEYASAPLLVALAGSTSPDSVATTPLLGGLVSYITVARLMGRRPWNVLSVVVVGSLLIVTVLSGGITVAGILISVFTGWGIGLLVRYVLGTPTTRPSGVQVADAMARGGFPVTLLQAAESTHVGRRYVATTRSGDRLEVVVLDRDLEGAGLANAMWRSLRLRDYAGAEAFNMRRAVDHSALMAYAAQAAGAPLPRLQMASEVGPDSAMLAYEHIPGRTFSEIGDALTDADLEGAWRAMRTLHEHQVAHRALTADHLLRDAQGHVWLLGEGTGAVAASDVSQRVDIADLLSTLALLTDAERAVRTGRRVLGVTGLSRALPVLQPVALTPSTRRQMRRNKDLMVTLRDLLVEIRPDGDPEQIQLERVRPRTLIMIVLGSVAAYVLLSQLAQVDLVGLVRNAQWQWVAVAVAAALVTYVGAAWSLSGFVPERLSLWRTMLAQVAGDFATLVSPPTLGAVAINLRFLQKAGLHPALAAASVGVSQVAAFVVHLGLLFVFGIAAGTQADFTFDPPRAAVIAVIVAAILLLGLLAVPAVRRMISGRVGPLLREVVPRLITVAQRPIKLVEGIGGILLLNLAYIVVLGACVYAFGGSLGVAAIGFVYLAGATIGQAAPTPGGLGAVEAALSAGLIATGLDGGVAVSAVLLYRLVTFWIPTVPGYVAFTWLQKKGAL
jgi:glycosyltransferase 2 family protein